MQIRVLDFREINKMEKDSESGKEYLVLSSILLEIDNKDRLFYYFIYDGDVYIEEIVDGKFVYIGDNRLWKWLLDSEYFKKSVKKMELS